MGNYNMSQLGDKRIAPSRIPEGTTLMSTFLVTIETDEDGLFVASCPGLPGCHTQGADFEEALENIKDAIEIYVEHMTADERKPDGKISVQLVEVPVTV